MAGILLNVGVSLLGFAVLLGCPARAIHETPTVGSHANAGQTTRNEMENVESAGKPELTVSFSAKEGNLKVEYRVKNTTATPIYLFNVIMHTDEIDTLSPHKFYSSLRDDGTVVLAKGIPKLPAIASVEVRDIPLTTKVEAGKEFGETVDVPLPLEEYNPYFQKDPESKVEERVAERVYLVVQYIREKEGLEVKQTKIGNAFKVDHPDLFSNVESLKSDLRGGGFKVNRRLDTFERF